MADHPTHLRGARVHGGEAAGEPGPEKVAQYRVAHRIGPAARTHDDHGPWREDRRQARDVGPLLPHRERVEVGAAGIEVELDVHLVALDPAPHGQAGLGQYLSDTVVLRQHVRDEPAHTGAPGAGRQVFQQQRSDPVRLLRMRHCQRDLGRRRVVGRGEALRHTDQRLATKRPQRHVGRTPPPDHSLYGREARRH